MTASGSATSRELGRPHPEERACGSAAANQVACARVSKDEDVALMLRDASQRASAVGAAALAFRCDAPQYEGEERRTNLRV